MQIIRVDIIYLIGNDYCVSVLDLTVLVSVELSLFLASSFFSEQACSPKTSAHRRMGKHFKTAVWLSFFISGLYFLSSLVLLAAYSMGIMSFA